MGKLGLLLMLCGCTAPAVPNCTDPSCMQQAAPDMAQPRMSAGLTIPKSGPAYSGMHSDPGLNSETDCPDAILEPNDGPDPYGHPLAFTPTPDQQSAKIIKLAICPKGPSPLTGMHDEDWFRVDNSTGVQLTLKAQLLYDISMGDLDVAITDETGHILASDGTAVSNGCVTSGIGLGVYHVVVVGANDTDVNNYELTITSFTRPRSCP